MHFDRLWTSTPRRCNIVWGWVQTSVTISPRQSRRNPWTASTIRNQGKYEINIIISWSKGGSEPNEPAVCHCGPTLAAFSSSRMSIWTLSSPVSGFLGLFQLCNSFFWAIFECACPSWLSIFRCIFWAHPYRTSRQCWREPSPSYLPRT